MCLMNEFPLLCVNNLEIRATIYEFFKPSLILDLI